MTISTHPIETLVDAIEEDMHFFVDGRRLKNVAMQPSGVYFTLGERESLISEIRESGKEERDNWGGVNDADLARAVLEAWKQSKKERAQ